jgi:hypothetical protein
MRETGVTYARAVIVARVNTFALVDLGCVLHDSFDREPLATPPWTS